ncbi:hypothetical protein H2248_007998 [Termitomyces sp. 'cryptogamus']|nr:hypothetical protein H2248_007998 [Termitomyces sp. 'cryptogamus']
MVSHAPISRIKECRAWTEIAELGMMWVGCDVYFWSCFGRGRAGVHESSHYFRKVPRSQTLHVTPHRSLHAPRSPPSEACVAEGRSRDVTVYFDCVHVNWSGSGKAIQTMRNAAEELEPVGQPHIVVLLCTIIIYLHDTGL